jgi:hypothetical protein
MQKIGSTMTFTGGAEVSPTVQVSRFVSPLGRFHYGDPTFLIKQGEDRFVILSPETMKAILKWYEGEDK